MAWPLRLTRIGTHIGDLTFLVQLLGSRHGRFGAEAESTVGFLLQRAGGKRRGPDYGCSGWW